MTTNIWTELIKQLYVVTGYWDNGYVVDEPNDWDTSSQTSNTWTTIG
jgi:hypothetical protein